MIIFIPVYNFSDGWQVMAINPAISKYHKTPGYPASITNSGMIYNGENIFTNYEGARFWIAKEYVIARQYEYMVNPADWHICKK